MVAEEGEAVKEREAEEREEEEAVEDRKAEEEEEEKGLRRQGMK